MPKFDKPYTQAVSWPSTQLGNNSPADFEAFIAGEFNGTRAKYIGDFTTLPDEEPGSGGRIDLCFAVHEEDVGKFAVARFAYGMRWVDDVIGNENERIRDGQQASSIYVPEFHDLCSWGQSESGHPEYVQSTGDAQ